METTEMMRREISRMAVVMDRVIPGWWERVDTNRLDMMNCAACVLGQQPGGYGDNLFALDADILPSMGWSAFDWGGGHHDYWLHEIALRRLPEAPQAAPEPQYEEVLQCATS